MNKKLFYLLSFTWGLPMSLIGSIVFLVLMIAGHKPKKFNYVYYIEVGNNWGGLNFGCFFITSKNPSLHTKQHECGHGIQNCIFGVLFPFIVTIPSAIRYWYRKLRYHRKGKNPKTKYDDIWFEGQATRLGEKYFNYDNRNSNN